MYAIVRKDASREDVPANQALERLTGERSLHDNDVLDHELMREVDVDVVLPAHDRFNRRWRVKRYCPNASQAEERGRFRCDHRNAGTAVDKG